MSAEARRNGDFCVKAILLSGCGFHDVPDDTYGCMNRLHQRVVTQIG